MNELVFKQWHDEDFTFHKEMKIDFSQCTPDRIMTWAEILRFTSDNAGEDFARRGMPWDFLQEKGVAFIVSRVSFHVEQMPIYEQTIRLNTWESAPQGPFATRNFELIDAQSGSLLIKAQTQWVVFGINNHRILPAKAFTLRPSPTIVTDFAGIKPGKIVLPDEMETIAKHKVLFSELDANGHTNNSKYINFVIDNLPADFQKKPVKDLRLNYSREAHLGEELEIKAKYDSEAKVYYVQGVIDGTSSFEAELYY